MQHIRLRITAADGTAGPELRLTGEVDPLSCPALAAALEEALRSKPARVTVDLSEVDFIDSAGLRTLVDAHESATAQGTVVALRAPTRATLRLLQITALDALFAIEAAS